MPTKPDELDKELDNILSMDDLDAYESTEDERVGVLGNDWVNQSRIVTQFTEQLKWKTKLAQSTGSKSRKDLRRDFAPMEERITEAREALRVITRQFLELWTASPRLHNNSANWTAMPENLRTAMKRLMEARGTLPEGLWDKVEKRLEMERDEED